MQRISRLVWIGSSLAVVGVVLLCSWESICSFISRKELALGPSSLSHWFWKESRIPITLNIYLFNFTNPEQLMEKDFKPELVQLGPYSFIERDEKVDVSWNANHTVTYQLIRRFYYDPHSSNGSLHDNFTSLDAAALALSHTTRYWSYFSAFPLSAAVRLLSKSVFITKSVGDYLIHGYSDPLLTLSTMAPGLSASKTLKDKIGIVYERNASTMFDGVMNVNTGEDDLSKMGTLHYYNYDNHTDNFAAHCGAVTGGLGELFGSISSRKVHINVFVAEICRSMQLDYLEDVNVNGVIGYRYMVNKKLLDNGTTDPDTWCNCGGDCLPQGVINTTQCLRNVPLYTSYPHYLDADPYYRRQVNGLQPDPDIHSFYVTVEPTTGIPLDARFVFQFNLLLQANPNIGLYRDVPTVMIPVVWFEKRFSFPPKYMKYVSVFLNLPVIGLYISVGLLSLGIFLLAFTFLHEVFVYKKQPLSRRRNSNVQMMSEISSNEQDHYTCPGENALLGTKVTYWPIDVK